MSFLNNKKVTGTIITLFIIVLFVTVSITSSIFENNIQEFVGADTYMSKVAYVFITTIAIIIAPISTLPLIPLASHIWGWFITGILSVIGWVIGSQIAFCLARRFGKSFVKKVFLVEKLNSFENYFPNKNLFLMVVFLRMLIPVDILSYALGLFSKISAKSFFFSTLIGVTPFAFIFSYTGSLSVGRQIITFIEIFAFFGIIYLIRNFVINKKV